MPPKAICTIGYEGGTIDAFIRALKQARIELVLDIRAAPVSRKKGFSKNQLAAHLSEAGIGYRHLRGLGTPKRARGGARRRRRKLRADLSRSYGRAGSSPRSRRGDRACAQDLRHLFVEASAAPSD